MGIKSDYLFEIVNELPEKISSHLHSLERFSAKAFLIGSRIFLRKLGNRTTSHAEPIFLALPENGVAAVFHYGVIVVFNLKPHYEQQVIDNILPYVAKIYDLPDTELTEISVKPHKPEGIYNDVIYIKKATRAHLELIAIVLSKSVVLDYYEQRVSASYDNIEPLAKDLKEKGDLGQSSKVLLRHIGGNLLTQHEMAGKMALNEKPALLWEHTDLELLYANLTEDLEIADRQSVLEKKIALLYHTAETSLDIIQHRHAARLEWYIIILIIISIIIELYTGFVHDH